jgi:predicted dehydrogenase
MKTIRWGIIGTGNIANSFASDFSYCAGGELVAVASRSMEKARDFAKQYSVGSSYDSYEALCSDPKVDAVYIATPHSSHYTYATLALQNGKAVLCEKPLTTNTADCQRLIDLAKTNDVYLMEALWTYFLPPILKAINWISEGRIGKIENLKADFGFKATFDPHSRLFNPDLAGGALLDIGIYPIALSLLVFQEMPRQSMVTSELASTGVDIDEEMTFLYDDGAKAELTATFQRQLPNEAIISGDLGYIKIPEFFMARECSLFDHNHHLLDHTHDSRKSTGYHYEIDAVNRDLMAGKKQSNVVPLKVSLKLQKIMAMVAQNF